ncbi:MAG: AAA family ATPase [Bryobacterales bacterium]|nr:AAA family ATPase [Bryobacterales bacterium]
MPAAPPPNADPVAGLAEAILSNQCVLLGGNELGVSAGLPRWSDFTAGLFDWALRTGHLAKLPRASVTALKSSLAEGQGDLVMDSVVNTLEASGQRAALVQYIRKQFHAQAPAEAHRILSRLGFCAVMSSEWDELLEQAMGVEKVLTFMDEPPPYFHTSEFFGAKLYGDLHRPSTMIFSASQFLDALEERGWQQFLQGLMVNRTMFFVGVSLDGIESSIEAIRYKRGGRQHFALVAVPPGAGASWQVRAEKLSRRFSVSVIGYDNPAHLVEFLRRLEQRVHPVGKAPGSSAAALAPGDEPSRLRRLVVDNVGPFEHAEFDFDPRWNVLLGNNGVGKSSVLRALAVAICGPESAPVADRIIRAGQSAALIRLETDRQTYLTQVNRTPSGCTITQSPVRPLEAEGWLALAFPPLRSASGGASANPSPDGMNRPTAEDLLPLLRGDADPRLEKLKQWIINLDYRIKDQQTQSSPDARFQHLFDEFFRIVGRLTEGVAIEEPAVNPSTRQVTVKTNDGIVPLDYISQGTASLLSWVGVVLQRLYEVFGKLDEPSKRHAIVLIDEIDAHMHPGWQQMLTVRLEEIFPNVQFIATTHSPLIIGGLTGQQVLLFERDPARPTAPIEISKPRLDFRGLRADQILTSVFGLLSSRDARASRLHELKVKSYGGVQLTAEEARELRELETGPSAQNQTVAETPAEKEARERAEAQAKRKMAAVKPQVRKQALNELAAEMRRALKTKKPAQKKARLK